MHRLALLLLNCAQYALVCAFAVCYSRVDFAKLAALPRLVVLACVLRMVWLVCDYQELSPSRRCEDREAVWVLQNLLLFTGELAQIVFLIAFSSLMFFWWDVLLGAKRRMEWMMGEEDSTTRRRCNPNLLQILLNLWIVVLWVSLFAYRLWRRDCSANHQEEEEESKPTADYEDWEEALLMGAQFFALAVAYFLVGLNLVTLLGKSTRSTDNSTSGRRMRCKILAICAVCVPLFAVKAVLLGMTAYGTVDVGAVGGGGVWWYPWFYSTLPEIVPSLVILYLLRKRRSDALALEDAALLRPVQGSSQDDVAPSHQQQQQQQQLWQL